MTAQELVRELVGRLSVSEQLRLLVFFRSPKAKYLTGATIKYRKRGNGPVGDEDGEKRLEAVAGR